MYDFGWDPSFPPPAHSHHWSCPKTAPPAFLDYGGAYLYTFPLSLELMRQWWKCIPRKLNVRMGWWTNTKDTSLYLFFLKFLFLLSLSCRLRKKCIFAWAKVLLTKFYLLIKLMLWQLFLATPFRQIGCIVFGNFYYDWPVI